MVFIEEAASKGQPLFRDLLSPANRCQYGSMHEMIKGCLA